MKIALGSPFFFLSLSLSRRMIYRFIVIENSRMENKIKSLISKGSLSRAIHRAERKNLQCGMEYF